MTFAELITTLSARGALKASRVKDIKTSTRYLVAALGQPSLELADVDAACRDEATWAEALDAHFTALTAQGRTISAATRRNTRNDLRVLFRQAEAHGLLTAPMPLRLLTKGGREDFVREQRATSPYQTTYYVQNGPRRFGLRQAQWPPDIQAGFRAYQAKCGLRLRPITFRGHADRLTTYLGYLANICGRTPTWEDVFDVASLAEFVRWHGARLGRPITTHGHAVAQTIGAIAVVLKHPHAPELAEFRNTLPKPAPLHNKRAHHWISLARLEHVAEACLASGRAPYITGVYTRNPGVRRATHFQRGVMLKMLVRIPLRQRNLREMRLGTNLYEDHQGHWHLHFSGSELKIGERDGGVNEYHVDITNYRPDLVPVLQEFLTVYRPRIPNPTASPLVFLTHSGRPFTQRGMHATLGDVVTRYTGVRFFPHLIRTIWATECIEKERDFVIASTMLGDTLAVTMKTYYNLVHKDQYPRASAFLDAALHAG
jgi:hypothetical protein